MELALITEIYDRSCLSLVIDEYCSSLFVSIVETVTRNDSAGFRRSQVEPPSDGTIRAFLNRLLDLSVQTALQGSPE